MEGSARKVWQTSLQNPDFAEFASLCGGEGWTVSKPEKLDDVLVTALASPGPALVEVISNALA